MHHLIGACVRKLPVRTCVHRVVDRQKMLALRVCFAC